MGQLRYSLVENGAELRDFDCGNDSINKQISDSFYSSMLRQSLTYKVCIKDHLVGFYRVSIQNIKFENTDTNMGNYFDREPNYCAVRLDFIAVDKKAQNQHIGTETLTYIVQSVHALYQKWPVRVLVLEALRDKIKWYQNRGFDIINKAELSGNSETVYMFLDLMPQEDAVALDKYTNTFYS